LFALFTWGFLFSLFALGGICLCIYFSKMEDRSWMYDGAEGDPLLYFRHATQFVEATKMHALHMNKKEIWCSCKNCENNVLWTMAKTICEYLMEMGFVDNYSI
jgi:hypothetical protein